jgi:hypothetical protein
MRKRWLNFRIGILHAKFHRKLKKADAARAEQDPIEFKKYIYQAEDAWRKIVILTEKLK